MNERSTIKYMLSEKLKVVKNGSGLFQHRSNKPIRATDQYNGCFNLTLLVVLFRTADMGTTRGISSFVLGLISTIPCRVT